MNRPLDKTTRRFRDISSSLAELNAEGLHAPIVNDLLIMYVGAASQDVLRMSFVLEDEAQRFDTEVIVFWREERHLRRESKKSDMFGEVWPRGGRVRRRGKGVAEGVRWRREGSSEPTEG